LLPGEKKRTSALTKRQASAGPQKLDLENDALRTLTLKLGRIILSSAGGPAYNADNLRMPVFGTLSPEQIVTALRDLALECERLVRLSAGHQAAEDFQAIGIEFADRAAEIEQACRIPGGAAAKPL
jgi:hypothetical protein